jgi:diacylglycerol kinase family enzyme
MLGSVRDEPLLTVRLPGRDPVSGVHFAFVSNASPWTYANTRPVWTNPETTFESGLGVFAITSMNFVANLLVLRRMLSKKANVKGKHLIREDDVAWVRITSAEPISCQVDGDFLGMRDDMTFTAVPQALAVVAPAPN